MWAYPEDAALGGGNLVAGRWLTGTPSSFRALDPRSQQEGSVAFAEATDAEVDQAARAAREAFGALRAWPQARVAELLGHIAARLEDVAGPLVAVADRETALGETRLQGELARTCHQLRAFARMLEEGWHLGAIIDTADPGAVPTSRPDLRRMLIPLGPVAVFPVSNFPLAFGVCGGDTASALAAGCPVVVKAHPAHPGTSELCARAVVAALLELGAPAGVFGMVHGRGHEVGGALVAHPAIAAVGFTGSFGGGRALLDLATNRREEPIPVYAEMGSVNPLFVTARALTVRAEEIALGLAQSVALGTGQFCTKPGLCFVPDVPDVVRFLDLLRARLAETEPAPLLTPEIASGYTHKLDATMAVEGVDVLLDGRGTDGCHGPSLLATDLTTFERQHQLGEEHFGPMTLVVRCPEDTWEGAVRLVGGNLAAAIHCEEQDEVASLAGALAQRVGRVIVNGFPTGVAVTEAMTHGGPFPATTNPLHTSVGATAVRRFLRPVTYQNAPQGLLPPALRDDNPLGLWRRVNGTWTDGAVDAS